MNAEDASRSGPGVVVIGVPAGFERAGIIERWTAHGYAVAAVDVDTAADVDAELTRLQHALAVQRALPAADGKVAIAAYGAAGALGFLAVTRLHADAAAIVRGAGIAPYLKLESPHARVPMSMHFDDADAVVPFDDVRKIKGALEGVGTIEIYRYERWDDAAAAQAERRVFEMLDTLVVRPG